MFSTGVSVSMFIFIASSHYFATSDLLRLSNCWSIRVLSYVALNMSLATDTSSIAGMDRRAR
jgi:hypothetical protein